MSPEPTPKKSYDAERYWAKRYESIDITKSGHIDLPVAYNKWLYRRKVERLLQGLKNAGFDAEGASVLEIATGTGIYVELWQRLGVHKLVGIDISQAATDLLKNRFPKYEFHKRDLSEPGLEAIVGNGFDVVTAVDMLYHIVDDSGFPMAIQNLADAVKPGGYLVIHDMFLHGVERDFGYIKLRTLEKYHSVLNQAGFEVVSRTPTFFCSVQGYDFSSRAMDRLAQALWEKGTYRFAERWPNVVGSITYWVDRLLGSIFREGPSFEMMICRRNR